MPPRSAAVEGHVGPAVVAEEAAPILNPAVISDVMVGALLARAALDSAAVNVEINIASMTDAGSRSGMTTFCQPGRGPAAFSSIAR